MNKPGTPLPWVVRNYFVCSDDLDLDVAMAEESAADAAYIVEACNAYPHLVAALRKLVEECKTLEMLVGAEADKLPSAWEAMFNQINAAIAEAERLLNEN